MSSGTHVADHEPIITSTEKMVHIGRAGLNAFADFSASLGARAERLLAPGSRDLQFTANQGYYPPRVEAALVRQGAIKPKVVKSTR